MRNDVKEANAVFAKCRKSRKMYGIRIERRTDNIWHCAWAFPIPEKGASIEGYDNVMISGRVDVDAEYPGCPYCGAMGWVSCNKCKKLTCWLDSESTFTCTWCGASGTVTAAKEFDLKGGGY